MSHMFCTLQEAAQTLNTNEDQIKALLEKGLLHEFREGPHCLVKEADVGALALQRRQRRESSSPVPPPTQAGRPLSACAGPRSPQLPRPQDTEGRRLHHGRSAPGRPGMPYTKEPDAYTPWPQETGPRRPDRRPSESLSVRQWFWMGLVQDRPVAIALLAGLVLSLLSALVAGLCYLAHAS